MTRLRFLAGILLLGSAAFVALLFTMPVDAQQSDLAKHIGGKFMCMCGCNQVLTQCNHVGCTTSASMLKELDQALEKGSSEDAITQMFVQEYGTKVYAEPPKSGFSLVAWSLPSIYLLAGTVLVILIISRWRKRPAHASATVDPAVELGISREALERARAQAARDTED